MLRRSNSSQWVRQKKKLAVKVEEEEETRLFSHSFIWRNNRCQIQFSVISQFYSVPLFSFSSVWLCFFFCPLPPSYPTRCTGSGAPTVMWSRLNTIAGVCHWLVFLWKSVGFPGDGERWLHFTLLRSWLPTHPPPPAHPCPNPTPTLPHRFKPPSLSPLQAALDQVACEHAGIQVAVPLPSDSQSLRPQGHSRWVT